LLLRELEFAVDEYADRIEHAFKAGDLAALDDLAADVRPAGPKVLLGRSRDCDCVVSEPSVSRRHAELRRQGRHWLVRDLGSRNGTRVNGLRVLEETEVRPGDRLSLGEVRFRLVLRRLST
jgi:pSer/pThr/pTyr-binding forkhead associated (FHA) protein